ncbi:hypothetical protein PRIPAC_78020 [Pristionchus pacificus]|uniref:Uncharacterized protein n=1 Tax=Pristionchus pacificus TaxID=54126 RepID=A0A2A6BVJ5_PRIPA|nr:hypothetical protein PRIPAC_78020 [Pristionchus pacificus]|eukprot:PDM69929.1 hypothetical protein PRIPAC_49141 [Pristionchus pacificus]
MGSILPRPARGEPRDLEDDGTLSPLERLPAGLLWDIMEHAPTHASPLLRYRVDKCVRLERNLPGVQAFNGPSSWSYNVHNAVFQADKSALLGVVMWFTPKYPLFNLRLLLTQPTCIISRLYRLRTGFLKLKFDLRKADLPVLEHIARYMGKRMDKGQDGVEARDEQLMEALVPALLLSCSHRIRIHV